MNNNKTIDHMYGKSTFQKLMSQEDIDKPNEQTRASFNENIGIIKNGQRLILEKKSSVNNNPTLYLETP